MGHRVVTICWQQWPPPPFGTKHNLPLDTSNNTRDEGGTNCKVSSFRSWTKLPCEGRHIYRLEVLIGFEKGIREELYFDQKHAPPPHTPRLFLQDTSIFRGWKENFRCISKIWTGTSQVCYRLSFTVRRASLSLKVSNQEAQSELNQPGIGFSYLVFEMYSKRLMLYCECCVINDILNLLKFKSSPLIFGRIFRSQICHPKITKN